MEWLLIGVVAGAGGLLAKRWRDRASTRAQQQEELQCVRRLADEDVTFLGEQLQRLDREVAGRELDEPSRADYQTALDAYESAQRAVPQIRRPDQISKVTDALSTGRNALACVQARVSGQPVPELRVPCFFNPQHGPSAATVIWTPPGGRGTRSVPACAQDAARVAAHEAPEVRKVRIGTRTVPYWEAGTAFQPYTEGYFASSLMLAWAYQAPIESLGGFQVGGGYDGGGGGGGFDGGGFGDGGGGGGGDGGGGGN